MPRKFGDYNFAEYYHYQAFSSDEPTKRINDTNFFLKCEEYFNLTIEEIKCQAKQNV